MKTSVTNRFVIVSALLAASHLGPAACLAQTPPNLGMQFSAGHPMLVITGEVGTVYSIRYVSGLSPTNLWVDRTLVQVQAGNNTWTDPSAPAPSQRFYRAVSVAAPADTNLVFIQPGTFTMGSPPNEVDRSAGEGPQHPVTISRGFWMGKYLVTQGDYLTVVGINPSFFNGTQNGTDYGTDLTRPVEQVTWLDATNYCALLTEKALAAGQIPANCVYRLPTEAEWEYACRAGTTTRFFYGDDPDYTDLVNYAWYGANSGGRTQPVGQLLPNEWGLYDMVGNVAAWCQDWYGPYSAGSVTDPQGPASSPSSDRVERVLGFRGCCAPFYRSASRNSRKPYTFLDAIGFRVVLALRQ